MIIQIHVNARSVSRSSMDAPRPPCRPPALPLRTQLLLLLGLLLPATLTEGSTPSPVLREGLYHGLRVTVADAMPPEHCNSIVHGLKVRAGGCFGSSCQ